MSSITAVTPADKLFNVSVTVNSLKGRATVAGPSVSLPREVSRRCGSQKLGGPNGNRTRLLAVTVRNTNRYTIGPDFYSQAPRMPIYASSAKSAKADAVILGSVAGRCDPNSVGVPTRYLIDA